MDDRLRTALRDDVADLEPDVEQHLAEVRHRSRVRSSSLPAMATTLVVLTSALAFVLVVAPGLTAEPSSTPAPVASTAPVDPGDALVGTYRMRLADPQVADPSLVGDWVLVFDAESRVTLTAPTTFRVGSDAPSAGYAYSAREASLVTNLLGRQLGHDCAGPGFYRWVDTLDGLAFETIADTCAERRTILTSQDWKRLDG
jgi:hypothetical protein